MSWEWMHGSGWSMALTMVALWGGVVALIVVLVALVGDRAAPRAGKAGERARELLAERYARGEIDTEEFQARARALESSLR